MCRLYLTTTGLLIHPNTLLQPLCSTWHVVQFFSGSRWESGEHFLLGHRFTPCSEFPLGHPKRKLNPSSPSLLYPFFSPTLHHPICCRCYSFVWPQLARKIMYVYFLDTLFDHTLHLVPCICTTISNKASMISSHSVPFLLGSLAAVELPRNRFSLPWQFNVTVYVIEESHLDSTDSLFLIRRCISLMLCNQFTSFTWKYKI